MKGLYIFDAEADGLLDDMTHFHCILFKAYGEKKFYLFLDEKHEEYGPNKSRHNRLVSTILRHLDRAFTKVQVCGLCEKCRRTIQRNRFRR